MNGKWMIICVFLVLIIGGGVVWFMNVEEAPSSRTQFPPTEKFIRTHLLDGSGMVRTNFANTEEGQLYLSESNGLWLIYLALINDEQAFRAAYADTKKHLQTKNKLFAWRIHENKIATTNALIDDLRIVRALYLMAEKTNNKKWLHEANVIADNIQAYHSGPDGFVDFYDWEHDTVNKELTISYIDLFVLQKMVTEDVLSETKYAELLTLMKELPTQNGWYPYAYHWENDEFIYHKEVNMIDQMYIALHLEEANIDTSAFYSILTKLFAENNTLYGRYEDETKEAAVLYESVAVYALAFYYANAIGETAFAQKMIQKMESFQYQNEQHIYDGGYVDVASQTTHSFDNLLALIAERVKEDASLLE